MPRRNKSSCLDERTRTRQADALRSGIDEESLFRLCLSRHSTGRPRENVVTLWRKTVAVFFLYGFFLHDEQNVFPRKKNTLEK